MSNIFQAISNFFSMFSFAMKEMFSTLFDSFLKTGMSDHARLNESLNGIILNEDDENFEQNNILSFRTLNNSNEVGKGGSNLLLFLLYNNYYYHLDGMELTMKTFTISDFIDTCIVGHRY